MAGASIVKKSVNKEASSEPYSKSSGGSMEHAMGISKMMANNRQAANPKAFKMNTSPGYMALMIQKILLKTRYEIA
jgi:hypothetical protein